MPRTGPARRRARFSRLLASASRAAILLGEAALDAEDDADLGGALGRVERLVVGEEALISTHSSCGA